jgi:hypothetical protein
MLTSLEFYYKLMQIKPFFERVKPDNPIKRSSKKVYTTHKQTKLVYKGGGMWIDIDDQIEGGASKDIVVIEF